MRTFELPKSISSLAEELQLVQMLWQGVPLQIPKFAVYAIIENPVFDRVLKRDGRQIGMLDVGKYRIPILNPFRGDTYFTPNYAVIISHTRDNVFGLYGYPADHVETDIHISTWHKSVNKLVQDYV